MFSREAARPAIRVNRVLKKLGVEIKLEKGDWCISAFGFPELVGRVLNNQEVMIFARPFPLPANNFIPLLHWEKIVKILRESGYDIDYYSCSQDNECRIRKGQAVYVDEWNEHSMQEAVIQAVIKLGKELK